MRPFAEVPRRRRLAGFTLVAVLVTAVVATGIAAIQPRVDNPHGKFRQECSMCHTAETWKIARVKSSFDHSKFGFRLAGAHAAAGCMSCHTSLQFAQAKTQCASCHTDPHRGELGADCARCHSDRSFIDRGPMVRAHQLTRFPLTGGHAALDCESCHQPVAQGHMQFVGTPAECQACHMPQYQSVKTPDHAAANYPLQCLACHSTVSWDGAKFNHEVTGFALTGAHRLAACVSCHVNNRYAGTPAACASCHMTEYNGATPNHAATGFSASACATCHNTTQWAGAVFDHNRTQFPLTGAHVGASCMSCHADGVYDGKPTACISCHQSDYSSASPTHTATNFPSAQCATCHTTLSWSGATLNHDGPWFPIYSGRHAGTWSSCTNCHTNTANYTVFTCFSCHPHSDQAETNSHHNGVSNYQYLSSACYSCHPRGTH